MLQQLSQMGETIVCRQQCELSNNYAVNERQKEMVGGSENEMRICQHITDRQAGREAGRRPGELVLQMSLFPSRLLRPQIGYGGDKCNKNPKATRIIPIVSYHHG